MTDLELMVDLHALGEWQGPGSKEDTKRAISLMDLDEDQMLKILDLGCGTGAQTMVLAESLRSHIVAVDLFPVFLDKLNKIKEKASDKSVIQTVEASMDDLNFHNNEFDIIWSEGAIYNMGFEKGIKYWTKFLKPGGYLAVSEVTWLSESRPVELEEFWKKEYPEIDTASGKIKLLEQNGYAPIGYFVLPQKSWTENYYDPLKDRFDKFIKKHGNSKAAKRVVDEHRTEIDFYNKYKKYYSYGFYIARNNNW